MALFSYVLGRPVTSSVSWSVVRSRSLPARFRSGRPAAGSGAAANVEPDESPVREEEGDEFELDDLRPSQPAPPAGTADYTADWGLSEPIVSSVEGVEFERPGTLPTPPEDPEGSAR